MNRPRRILVYRIGALGDTMIALPAFHALRTHFANDRLTLLCNRTRGGGVVLARVLLERSGLLDEYLEYEGDLAAGTRLQRAKTVGRLLATLRAHKFDTLVYLAPSGHVRDRVGRDRAFFRAAGIREFFGMDLLPAGARPPAGQPLEPQPHEAQQLLQRLALCGIEVPATPRLDLVFTDDERRRVARWRENLGDDGGRPWVGLGPGSKMPAKVWPLERFVEVTQRLIDRYDVWPVVFGGPEDRSCGEALVAACSRGFVAAGDLDPRLAAVGMESCRAYLGNDTGTMHLAASTHTRCVAIFTARDWPGKWDPLGPGHVVLRHTIECEGCMLTECVEQGMECILSIGVNEVERACREILDEVLV